MTFLAGLSFSSICHIVLPWSGFYLLVLQNGLSRIHAFYILVTKESFLKVGTKHDPSSQKEVDSPYPVS